jgi:formylglycine-generating enzyme required for sulfatase activity
MDARLIKVFGVEKNWDLIYSDFVDSGYLAPGSWSPDGLYFYFSEHRYVDGGWFLGPFGLHRLRLEDGQVERILSGFMFQYDISPSGRQLAYINYSETLPVLTIRDLQTGVEKGIPLESDFTSAGFPLWSPDNKFVAVTEGEGGFGEEFFSSLVLVDVEAGNQRVLIDKNPAMIYAQEWSPDSQILVVDRGSPLGWYDINTGELVAPPPTTTPRPIQSTVIAPTPSATGTNLSKTHINPADQAELVLIPAGNFFMGSDSSYDPYFWGAESPIHQVYLDAFWIYRTEVTNAMYTDCVSEQACPRPDYARSSTQSNYYGNPEYADYPVVFVSWRDASAYCLWAGGSLPTEAQWEKAARGTDDRIFPWGSTPPSGQQANYCDASCPESWRDGSQNDGYSDTAPAGNYPAGASPYGVLDMAGNVWEWVFDWFSTG